MMFSLLVFIFSLVNAESINSPELYKQFETELESAQGVTVEVHGADHQNGLYVISYRPQNFFDYVIISLQGDYMSPNYDKVAEVLKTLQRHDFIQIKGQTNPFISPAQNHVMVNELAVVKKFTSIYNPTDADYQHYTDVYTELGQKTSAIVKVHASLLEGQIFVVEYGDANIPVVVKNTDLTKNLFRGDKVEIKYTLQAHPKAPPHFILGDTADSLRVIDTIANQHGQPLQRCGQLVMFPQSPQVKFNVFALMYDIGDNLFRTYTLINFEDMKLFEALRLKAQTAWDANTSTIVQGRNYFVNPKLKICANGTGNMIVPTQANPQILIDKIEDLTVEVLP